MRIFVATRAEDVPEDARPFVSVDGSVPGALRTWDHHVTGEPVNLDAMPPDVELEGLMGIGTTLADTDALASVVALLHGGKSCLPAEVREALYAASYRCDHLVRAPGADDAADRAGLALHRWTTERLAAADDRVSAVFESLCREVDAGIRTGRPLPAAEPGPSTSVRALFEAGRFRSGRTVACFDLRGAG